MASINWQKMTSQGASGLYVHLDQRAREKHQHSNTDIDRSKTKENYIIGADSFKDAIKSMKARTKAVDAVKPPLRVKKDRITCAMLVFPVPKEIERSGKADAFIRDMHKVIEDFFGAENVHGTFVHKDEVHTYTDSKTKEERESLIHAHTLVSAYTEAKGINGKAFETRARLAEFNSLVNQMCLERYGIEYNTGLTPRREKTEKMKIESARARAQKEIADILHKVQESEKTLETLADDIRTKKRELSSILPQLDAVKQVIASMDSSLCPEGVEEKTRGVFRKETYYEVPEKIWRDRWISANGKDEAIKSIERLKKALEIFYRSASGQREQILAQQVKEMTESLDKAHMTIRQYERAATYEDGKKEVENKVNRVLQRMPEEDAREFVKAWDADTQEIQQQQHRHLGGPTR